MIIAQLITFKRFFKHVLKAKQFSILHPNEKVYKISKILN